jgi:hypothetical protein
MLTSPSVETLLSDERFPVDGTLIRAWASMKSFRRTDGSDELPGRSATARATFATRKGLTRRTHPPRTRMRGWRASPTGRKPKLAYIGHLLMANRSALEPFALACERWRDRHVVAVFTWMEVIDARCLFG